MPSKAHKAKGNARRRRAQQVSNGTAVPVLTLSPRQSIVPPRIASWVRADISGFIPTASNVNPNYFHVVVDPSSPFNAQLYNSSLVNINNTATLTTGYTINSQATLWDTYGSQIYANYRVRSSRIRVQFSPSSSTGSDDMYVAVAPGAFSNLAVVPTWVGEWINLYFMTNQRFATNKSIRFSGTTPNSTISNGVTALELFGVSEAQFLDGDRFIGVTSGGAASSTPAPPTSVAVYTVMFQKQSSNGNPYTSVLPVKVVLDMMVEFFNPLQNL